MGCELSPMVLHNLVQAVEKSTGRAEECTEISRGQVAEGAGELGFWLGFALDLLLLFISISTY